MPADAVEFSDETYFLVRPSKRARSTCSNGTPRRNRSAAAGLILSYFSIPLVDRGMWDQRGIGESRYMQTSGNVARDAGRQNYLEVVVEPGLKRSGLCQLDRERQIEIAHVRIALVGFCGDF